MAAPALKVQLQGVTTVSSDNLNSYEQTCDTIAQLRGFVGADGVQVFVRGLTAPNDGGAGEFYWDDAATGPDNGVNVIVPTGSALGAWIRLVINGIDAVGTYSFATTVALLAAFAPTVVLASGTVAFTAGRTTEGDSGGGEFFYNAADTTTADNGGTIRVDAAGRRWYYVPTSNSIPAALFGAANTNADNTTVLNSALSGAAALGFPVSLQHSNFKCLGQLTWDTSKTSIQDGTLDMTGLTGTSVAFKQFTTWTDPNTMAGQHNLYPVRNVRIVGPNSGPGKTCFAPSPSTLSGLPWITGLTYRDMCVNGFDVMFDIPDGCVFPYFSNVQYGSDSLGHGSEWMFRNLGSTNSGENIYLDHCCCVNTYGFYLEQTGNANFDMFLNSCSMDGLGVMCANGTLGSPISGGISGSLTFLGGHWEPSWIANEYFAWVGNGYEAGSLQAYGVNFFIDNTTNLNTSPFRSDGGGSGTTIAPGIQLRDMQLFFSTTWPNNMMCVGTGNFECSIKGSGNSFAFNGALSSNRCPDYVFAGNGLSNWSGSPTSDGSDKPAGATNSGVLAGGHVSKFTTACLPGQRTSLSFWLKYTTPGAGDTLAISVSYLDGAGDVLTSNTLTYSSAVSSWTAEVNIPQTLAPAGAVNAQVQILYTPSGGGAAVKWALPIMMVQ